MSNYMTKAAAHARLLKLASAARLIRRQRALQKYAQAVQMQKQALGTGATAGIGAGLGGLIGGGIGYGLGKKDKKLLSALIGAGAGAGIGGLGGYGLGKYLNSPYRGLADTMIANGHAVDKGQARKMIADHKKHNKNRESGGGSLEQFSNADMVESDIQNGPQSSGTYPWVIERNNKINALKDEIALNGGDYSTVLEAHPEYKNDPEIMSGVLEWVNSDDFAQRMNSFYGE